MPALNLGFVTSGDFEYFKDRQNEFIENGFLYPDKCMRDINERFSKLPHIATVWSCSTHTLQERQIFVEDFDDEITIDARSHLTFVIEEGGEWVIDAFNTFQIEMDMKTWDYCRPQLNLLQSVFPGECTFERRYSCWVIEITTDINLDLEKKVCQLIWNLLIGILEDHLVK